MCLPEDHTYVLFFHPTPIGPKTTRNFTVGACNYGDPEQTKQEIATFQKIVYDQDRPILESQRPEELPEDLSMEMYLKGVDTFHVAYRSWLVELMRDLVPDDV
jgi:vanillate O-demethylase monooxygenase subunit